MANYKGTITRLDAIPPMTPVEVVDMGVFYKKYAPTSTLGMVGNVKVRSRGALNGTLPSYHPNFLSYDGKILKVEPQPLYPSTYNPFGYGNDGFLGTAEIFKVLTGAKGREIIAAHAKWVIENLKTSVVNATYFAGTGSDPEIFAVSKSGEVIPAWEFLPAPGTEMLGDEYMYMGARDVYWDGVQAEFTPRQTTCHASHVDSIRDGMDKVREKALKKYPDSRLTIESTIEVPLSILSTAEEKHVAFGCNPSLNAYGAAGEVIENPRLLPVRFAGGHIHLNGQWPHTQAPEIVKTLDAILGVASVAMFHKLEQPVRRRYYGLAGEYRLPAHGIEYRTLSNAWLCHPAITNLVLDMARWCTKAGSLGYRKLLGFDSDEQEVQRIINELDADGARGYIQQHRAFYEQWFHSYYGSHGAMAAGVPPDVPSNRVEVGMQLLMEGVHSVIGDPMDLEHNWKLGLPTSTDYMAVRKEGVNSRRWAGHSEGAGCQFYLLCFLLKQGQAASVGGAA